MDLSELEVALASQGYVTGADVREELRQMAQVMSTKKALAQKMGVSAPFLHDVIEGRRQPGQKILAFLHLEPVIVYKEKRNANRQQS